jgi:anaphase-promoting complex subunit 10
MAEASPAHPGAAAQAALFSLFGRGVSGRQRGQMMDEDDQDDEGDVSEDDDEEEVDQSYEMDHRRLDLEPEEDERDFSAEEMEGMAGEELEGEEDEDELMHDRGKLAQSSSWTGAISHSNSTQQTDRLRRYQATSAKYPP